MSDRKVADGYRKKQPVPPFRHMKDKPLFDDHYANLPPTGSAEARTKSLEIAMETAIVQHPTHYTQGIECWDYITSHKMGFLEGNIIKYVTRYQKKNGLQDLLKARQYLEKLIVVNGGEAKTEF